MHWKTSPQTSSLDSATQPSRSDIETAPPFAGLTERLISPAVGVENEYVTSPPAPSWHEGAVSLAEPSVVPPYRPSRSGRGTASSHVSPPSSSCRHPRPARQTSVGPHSS